jgi:thiamine pyrophosphate-dependent acetolactate synthase large subunit-like protein
VAEAVSRIRQAKHPVVLAGHRVARAGEAEALTRFAELLHVPKEMASQESRPAV